jgi:hypothetical protein
MPNEMLQIARANAALRACGCTPAIAARLIKKHGHKHMQDVLRKKELHLLEKLVRELDEIEEILEDKHEHHGHHKHHVARSSVLRFKTSLGDTSMPLTVHVNDVPGKAIYTEFAAPNGQGQVVPPTGAVLYESSDPTVATIDPSTGQMAYIGAGQTTITASDSGLPNATPPGLPASDVLTVTAAAAVSSTLTLNPGQ